MTFQPADEAPARGAKRTTAKAPRRPASTRSLRKEIDAFVAFLNGIIAVISPRDALDSVELAALVNAIDEEAKVNARFRRGIEALLNVTSGGSLWMVISIIAARRVARRGRMGKFGAVVDDGGSFILSTINAEPSEAGEAMANIINMFTAPADSPSDNDKSTHTPDSAAGSGATA